jgi:hypothetical protein
MTLDRHVVHEIALSQLETPVEDVDWRYVWHEHNVSFIWRCPSQYYACGDHELCFATASLGK